MNRPKITAIIIAKNEALMIAACIDCLKWCEHVIVIDNGSTDQTADIAEKKGASVISFKHDSFAKLRAEALKVVKTEWLIYIDADERVTPDLAKEIQVNLETEQLSALSFNRTNYFFGQEFQYGGWQHDVVTRAFQKSTLQGWHGKVHETPSYTGNHKHLNFPLIHFSHRNVIDGLHKTVSWTPIEAELLFKAGESPVTFGKILKKGVAEFIRRGYLKSGYKDGSAGMIEALVQGINRMLVYIQVWELQQKPSIQKKYEALEKSITEKWLSS